jgi:Asp-tRNA(Asn)/Glu-tRNA(Gln) amidotransferase A subunit family amidase
MYINNSPLVQTVEALQKGEIDLISHVEEMCDRVTKLDSDVEAMLPEPGRKKRLRAEAKELQERFPNPDERPPLFGALVAVKDIIHVSGFLTRAGSDIPPELFQGPEATCVSWLRNAGALILGKSVTTEFAYFEPGPTRNPHNLQHTPGGSSSGSAAAVAAGFCSLALGTQTAGSVIRPAAYCGTVGFKPTLNRIPTTGLIYFSRTVDHVGLFTQHVADMQLAATVLCQAWRSVPELNNLPTLGVPVGPYLEQAESEALKTFEHHLVILKEIGCTVKEVPVFSDIRNINRLHTGMVIAEFAQEHKEIYANHAKLYRPRTAEMIERGKNISDDELSAARVNCSRLRADLEVRMDQEGIDLWVSPPAPGPAPEGIHATGNPNMNTPWTHAGMPVVTLPGGRAQNGLPLGLQFVGSFSADEYLLAWCQMIADRMDNSMGGRSQG